MPLINFRFNKNNNNNTQQQQQQLTPPPPPVLEQTPQQQQQQKQQQPTLEEEQQQQQQKQINNHNEILLQSPNPLSLNPELTIAILHPDYIETPLSQSIQSKIESRISSTGFKKIHQITLEFNSIQDINALKLSTNAAAGLVTGINIIYLLSRSRAIQVWKDLVGIEPTLPGLPARPGSLKFMYGSKTIWAADRVESVYQLIHTIWPNSLHLLSNPQFHNLQKPFPPINHLHSSPNLNLSIQSHETTQKEKRVFKFSHPLAPMETTVVTIPTASHGNTSHSNSNTSIDDKSPSSSVSHVESRHFSRIPQSKNCSPSATSKSSEPLVVQSVINLTPITTTTTTTTTSSASAHNNNNNKNSILLPSPRLEPKSSSSSISYPSSVNGLDRSAQKSMSPTTSNHSSDTTSLPKPTTQLATMISNRIESNTNNNTNGCVPFRARPVPSSITEPIISPRMSKAAMLRLGLTWTPPPSQSISSSQTLNSSQSSNPSNNNTTTPIKSPPNNNNNNHHYTVASLNPPLVQPRETKTSKLRSNNYIEQEQGGEESLIIPTKKPESEIFENTPGHAFRRAHLVTNIASINPPKTEPRHTKTSALRARVSDPSSSDNNNNHSSSTGSQNNQNKNKKNSRLSVDYFVGVPGHKRKEKFLVQATKKPSIEPRMTKASLLRITGSSSSSPTTQNQNQQQVNLQYLQKKKVGGNNNNNSKDFQKFRGLQLGLDDEEEDQEEEEEEEEEEELEFINDNSNHIDDSPPINKPNQNVNEIRKSNSPQLSSPTKLTTFNNNNNNNVVNGNGNNGNRASRTEFGSIVILPKSK